MTVFFGLVAGHIALYRRRMRHQAQQLLAQTPLAECLQHLDAQLRVPHNRTALEHRAATGMLTHLRAALIEQSSEQHNNTFHSNNVE